jgi:hypothetical protein
MTQPLLPAVSRDPEQRMELPISNRVLQLGYRPNQNQLRCVCWQFQLEDCVNLLAVSGSIEFDGICINTLHLPSIHPTRCQGDLA